MFRFVALTWNTLDPQATLAAKLYVQQLRAKSSQWRSAIETAGLSILYAETMQGTWDVYPLKERMGVVFGKLFSREANFPSIEALSETDSAAIVKRHGRHLIDAFWGRYVSFIQSLDGRSIWVVRDPQGGLPCYWLNYRGVNVFFSNLEECVPQGLMRFSINEQRLAARVCGMEFFSYATGLNEITDVIPGECLTLHSDGRTQRTLYWEPAKIACTDPVMDAEEAAREIRRNTQWCTWAWARSYRRILHNLSGFDSSVVLSCLSSAPHKPTVVAANYFNKFGDERHFARLSARRAGCTLVEIEEGDEMVPLEYLWHIKKNPSPASYSGALGRALTQRRIAQEWNLEGSFGGVMGDQVYGYVHKKLIAIDHLLHHGFSRSSHGVITAIAGSDGISAWSILTEAAREYFGRPLPLPILYSDTGKMLGSAKVLAELQNTQTSIHPWLRAAAGVLPGKRFQIQSLTATFSPYDSTGVRRHIEIVPLLSQPLVEACLRIPLFVHSPAGVPRVAARRAFAQHISPEVVERTSKGAVDYSLQQWVDENREFLRRFMYEGDETLVKRGLLDPGRLRGLLSEDNKLFMVGAGDLMCSQLDTQAWLHAIAPLTKAYPVQQPQLIMPDDVCCPRSRREI